MEFYLLADSHWPRAEGDTFTKALVPSGDGTAIPQSNVITMHLMERQRRQVIGACTRRSRSCNIK